MSELIIYSAVSSFAVGWFLHWKYNRLKKQG